MINPSECPMILHIRTTKKDDQSLSEVSCVKNEIADTFDYSNVIVRKPWGNETLWFQDEKFAAWLLSIKMGMSTSFHCHAHKQTCLSIISGEVVCSTFEKIARLGPGDSIVLDPRVFHATRATVDSLVMEVETPPMKGDLIRLSDEFGRERSGYEAAEYYEPTIQTNSRSDAEAVKNAFQRSVEIIESNGKNKS